MEGKVNEMGKYEARATAILQLMVDEQRNATKEEVARLNAMALEASSDPSNKDPDGGYFDHPDYVHGRFLDTLTEEQFDSLYED